MVVLSMPEKQVLNAGSLFQLFRRPACRVTRTPRLEATPSSKPGLLAYSRRTISKHASVLSCYPFRPKDCVQAPDVSDVELFPKVEVAN